MQRLLAYLPLFLLPLAALADGKMYRTPTAVAANITMPDQRALIHYTNGTERLVIETRFTGAGTNFAWVVPLPSQPVVEAASTGLFPTLQYLFQPPITHQVTRYYGWILGAIGLLLSLRGIVVRFGSNAISILLIVFVLFMLAAMLLPALSKATAKGGGPADATSPTVSILDRQLVGVFETTTIASRDPKALQTWLYENGFVVTTNSEPVIESYVREGWVFVAAKVRRDQAANQTSTPHPLSFTFKTERPVYPMRLTGVDNGPLRVELYVFAKQPTQAANFKVERCARPGYPMASRDYVYRPPETPFIIHPLLRQWVDGSPVVTKLTATLSPEQMRQDVWLEWRSFLEKKSRRFSRAGAATIALNWGAGVLAVGLILSYVVALGIRPGNPQFKKPIQLAIAVSLATIGLIYVMLPKIEVRLVQRPYGVTRNVQEHPLFLVEGEGLEAARRILANPTNTVTKQIWEGLLKGGNWPNHYMGGMVHEEDSPGNFILREQDGLMEYVVFDAEGAERVLMTWPLPPRK